MAVSVNFYGSQFIGRPTEDAPLHQGLWLPMLVGSESQRGIDKPYCRWNWTRNGEDLCIFFTSRDGFQIFSEWASEFLNQKGPATPWVPGSNQAVVELWLGPNQTLPAKSGDDLTRYAWTSGFDATFGHRLGVLGVDHRWSISVVTPKKMEQSKCQVRNNPP